MKRIAALALISLASFASQAAETEKGALTLAEMNSIATAMEFAFLDTGFFTTIENLDDVTNPNPSIFYQYIDDGGGALVIDQDDGVPFRRDLRFSWGGPYLQGQFQGRLEGPDGGYDEGTILDLASGVEPYYFYTPLGLVEPKTGDLSQRFYGDQFDRYTLVSHGFDAERSDDDIILSFGGTITVRTISSARLESLGVKGAEAFRLIIRGYNLGSTAGKILFDGADSGLTPENWTSQEVTALLSSDPGNVAIGVELAGGATAVRTVEITRNQGDTAVVDWEIY